MAKNCETKDQRPSSELNRALKLCYALELSKAEEALNEVIRSDPNADSAYSAIALIKLMQGKPDQQEKILRGALTRNPRHYASLHQLSVAYFRVGRFKESHEYIKRALSEKPNNENSLLLASRICLQLGKWREAYQLAEKVPLKARNQRPQKACNLMAEALIATHDPAELCNKLVDSIAAGRGDTVKLTAASWLIKDLRHEDQCLDKCNKIIEAMPDNKFLRLLRTKILAGRGSHDDCFPDLYYLLSVEQDSPAILYGFAEAYLYLKRYRESLEVYLKIARIVGTDPQVLNQIGVCFRCMGRFRSSEKAYWRSIRLNPLDACIIGNLGEANFRFGNFERALELYTIALNIDPLYREVFYNKMLSFSIGGPEVMPEMKAEASDFWSTYRVTNTIRKSAPKKALSDVHHPISIDNKGFSIAKLRIGILSSDIGNHCVSYFLTSFLRHYDKERFHIELILCDRRYEEREGEICSYVDHAQSLEGLSEANARDVIRKLSLDLIIECNGYTGGSGISLLAERCAPIQCHYIGYHASTGLDTIDYFISDKHILSASVAEQLSEKPLKLDRAWLAFSRYEEFPRAKSTARVNRPLLGFFGNSTKITNITLEYWSALFHACPEAILVLKCLSYTDRYIVEKVLGRLESHGIQRSSVAILEPTASWKDHLDYYNIIDYALDSTPWSSATTGFDALGMGVPLLAIQGDTIAARMSSSLVTHLGRHEWLSTTPADYARLGEGICTEFIDVRREKRRLQDEVLNSSLFDGPHLARCLEKALLQAVQQSTTDYAQVPTCPH